MKGLMTWEKLQKMIASGAGQGHGENYLPFLTIRRRNTSPKSNQTVGPLPGQKRAFHGLARLERQIGLLCYWLGAHDVREQFPIWPFPHPHPLAGQIGAKQYHFRNAPGLLAIAKAANIKHGVFPGTDVPYVATLDVVATVFDQRRPRLVVFSCKPLNEVLSAEPTSRMLERLELERRYCAKVSARYHIAHELALPTELFVNLEICGAAYAQRDAICAERRFENYRDCLISNLNHHTIRDAVFQAAKATGIRRESAWPAFWLLGWNAELDLDLSKPTITSYVAAKGGQALRARLCESLFGGVER